jgi:hypothetical protein
MRTERIGLLGDQAGAAVHASGLGINCYNGITDAQLSTLNHPHAKSAMTAHGIVAAWTQDLLHA